MSGIVYIQNITTIFVTVIILLLFVDLVDNLCLMYVLQASFCEDLFTLSGESFINTYDHVVCIIYFSFINIIVLRNVGFNCPMA